MADWSWLVHSSITTRMRSVLERLQSENTEIYAAHGLETFPHWVAPLALIADGGAEGISAAKIAKSLKIAPPTVSQLVGDMLRAGIIDVSPDAEDRRRKRLALTPKGEDSMRRLEPLLRAYLKVSEDLERTAGVVAAVDRLAEALDEKPLAARIAEEMAKDA